ncbi:hypothetical protein A1A1_12002 [Planococcus antarcticus DSM 14505]|uniref:Uncharacterized protein n=1 Tax=Planococcus antarcticus DSM 14505 TaxID=1185653 RepID=A0A1C7DDI4_9BACL|nr:hypothetical protein [Planococcus antarcticus]ANU09505.1 hypothetical protein BBH88_03880 [Planococcus antarcticus DSM 14505]EIM06285.1 hypothetical protein A1A1_12002 [Planococcus antarcticus DSM 14505]
MKKKIFFILISTMLLVTSMSMTGLSAQANSYSEFKVTSGQEKQAEEIANEWVRFDEITSGLDEHELERLLEAMFESSGIQASSNATKKLLN